MMQQTAQGLAALGRGPDTMLVHMAPEEVAGLQALALKHGGTLTINPETGLAEAGFLKNILPMVAGFALNAFAPGVGTAVGSLFGLGSAAGTALTVGGIAGLTSGNLEKGLMAGLGAYGGAGLAEGFANAGTGAVSSAAGAGAPQVAAESIVPQAVAPAVAAPTSAVSATNVAPDLFGGTESEIAKAYGYKAASPLEAAKTVATVTPQINPAELAAQAVREQNAAAFMNEQAQQQAVAKALANKTDLVSAGFDVAKNAPSAFLKKNAMSLGALGIAALSSSDDKNVPTPSSPGLIRPYTYARTKNKEAFEDVAGAPLSSRERQYFNDQYTARTPYRAPGPEYMAVGGPVEDMSNGNDMAAYMGQDKFDQGGSVGGYAFNPKTGRYTSPGGRTSVGGYTYDPKTGLYTKPGGQGATTVPPKDMASGDSGSSGGGDLQPLNPRTIEFLENETPAQRDERMRGIDNLLSMVVPGGMFTRALGGFGLTGIGAIANAFGGTQAPAPVEDAVPKTVDEILNGVIVGKPIQDGPTVIQDLPPELGPVYSYPGDDSMDLGEPDSYSYPGNDSMDLGEPSSYSYPGNDSMDLGEPSSYSYPGNDSMDFGEPGYSYPGNDSMDFGEPSGPAGIDSDSGPSGGFDSGPAGIDSDSGPSGGFDSGGTGGEGGGEGGGGGGGGGEGGGDGGGGGGDGGGGGGDGGGDGGSSGDGSGGEARGGLSPDFRYRMAQGGLSALAMAQGGMFNLGSYSDGGRLLRGPGDGVSDSIPAMIGRKQKARLADGEFVIPARIVSELGNGSTEAGARQLYAMMDRVQKARRKTVGKDKVATNSRAAKLLPA